MVGEMCNQHGGRVTKLFFYSPSPVQSPGRETDMNNVCTISIPKINPYTCSEYLRLLSQTIPDQYENEAKTLYRKTPDPIPPKSSPHTLHIRHLISFSLPPGYLYFLATPPSWPSFSPAATPCYNPPQTSYSFSCGS